MVKSTVYNLEDNKSKQTDPAEISDILGTLSNNGVLWVDIDKPTDKDIDLLRSEFNIHPLALEDLQHREQRPKIVEYGDYIFCVLYELIPSTDARDERHPCVKRGEELHLVVGYNFFISVHTGQSRTLDDVRKRWESTHDQQALGPYYLLYLLLDAVTDNYFPAIDAFDERVERLEDEITDPGHGRDTSRNADDERGALSELVTLRHNLIMMRRVVTPLREAVNVLLRRVESVQERPVAEDDGTGHERALRARTLFAYFQDVYDHTIRIVDSIDTYRDILSGLVDANLSMVSNRTNDIMKVLTSVSIILMSGAFVTGLYGMNFELMPELHWKYGYAYAVGLILIICAVEWRYFRGRRWL